MIIINDSEKFESIINNIDNSSKKIEEIFNETSANMETVNDTDIWTGVAQKEFSNKYKELSNNYEAINNSLKIYINFLKQTIADYKELETQTNNDIETNNIQLDVNS